MKNKPSQELIDKYLAGKATLSERLLIEAALNQHMKQSEALRTSKDIEKASRRIKRRVFGTMEKPAPRVLNYSVLRYVAAAAVLVIGIFLWKGILSGPENLHQEDTAHLAVDARQVLAGGNRATLSFDDGSTLALDEGQQGIVMHEQAITYRDGRSLVESRSNQQKPRYATLATPKGGTYQITLPDGSSVWLNAASSLRYPMEFNPQQRVVDLQGEAYFEIKPLASSSKNTPEALIPFHVRTNRQVIEVLGTGFNVSDYAEEEETKTTLVEGSVRITGNRTAKKTVLLPGQQAVVNDHKTTVSKVDVEQFTAWKDGYFYFDRLSPQVVLAQMARWYDIDLLYETEIPKAPIFGMIDRKKNLGSVLSSLKRSGLNFKLVEINNRRTLVVLGEK